MSLAVSWCSLNNGALCVNQLVFVWLLPRPVLVLFRRIHLFLFSVCVDAAATNAAGGAVAGGGKVGAPGVMLAQNYTVGKNVVGYWVSEKLDGVRFLFAFVAHLAVIIACFRAQVRAYWNGKHFLSRAGNIFDAPEC